MTETLDAVLRAAPPLLAAVGLLFAVVTLRRNHDWNRRNYAIALLSSWDERMAKLKPALEKAFPGLVDVGRGRGSGPSVTAAQAEELFGVPGPPEAEADREARDAAAKLLNYFELVAVAYFHGVADRQIIDEGFRGLLTAWHGQLVPLIEAAHGRFRRGGHDHRPWQPFVDLVEKWRDPAGGRPFRPATDLFSPPGWLRAAWRSAAEVGPEPPQDPPGPLPVRPG